MATTSSKPPAGKGKGKGRGRLYLALGLVALLVLGYVIYKRSSSSSTGAPVTGSTGNPYGTSSSDGGGTGSGSADQSGADTAGLLSTLAGENQQLLSTFLAGEQGLITLAGSSQGNPAPTTGASPAPSPDTPAPAPAPAPAAAAAVPGSTGASALAEQGNPAGVTPVQALENQGLTPALAQQYADQPVQPLAMDEVTNIYGGDVPTVAANTPPPATPSAPYAVSSPANKSGLSATQKQGVISVH